MVAHAAKDSGIILDSCAQIKHKNTIHFKGRGQQNALISFLTLLKSCPTLTFSHCTIHVGENKNYQLECQFEQISLKQ